MALLTFTAVIPISTPALIIVMSGLIVAVLIAIASLLLFWQALRRSPRTRTTFWYSGGRERRRQ